MQLSLAGLWQVSPLTDLSIPQDDITFPAALSQALPDTLSEASIGAQEWHLMHDIEVDEAMLNVGCAELVIGGIEVYAEVRLNGIALFDCDRTQTEYRKDILPYLQLGRNRFEILLLEEDDDFFLFEEDVEKPVERLPRKDERLGIWQAPYVEFVRHVKLEQVVTEQIWHHGGGCEFKVDVIYQTYKPGLVSAAFKFNGMTFVKPIDVRVEHTGVIFQIDAPITTDPNHPNSDHLYHLEVELDGQYESSKVALNPISCVTQFLREYS